jgi:hypothetical protein
MERNFADPAAANNQEDVEENGEQCAKSGEQLHPMLRVRSAVIRSGRDQESPSHDNEWRDADQPRELFFGALRIAVSSRRAGKVDVEKNSRGVPTAKGPQNKGPEKSGNPRRVPLVARHPFANRPQNFGALSYTDEYRQGEESHDKTKAARLQFLVKISESPPKALEKIAVVRLGVVHRKDAAGLRQ